MADFSFLSDDSDNEKAVNELLSQAMDQSVLEQVAAINCSGFNDSLLPTQLETRFRKLKSLPTTSSKPYTLTKSSRSFCSSEFPKTKKSYDDDDNEKIEGTPVQEKGSEVNLGHGFVQENVKNDVYTKTPVEEKGFEVNLEHEFVKKQTKSKVHSNKDDAFTKSADGKKGKKSESLSGSMSSDSWEFSKDCLSPPMKTGCFWCSPMKKGSNKKGKENRGMKWGKNDDDDEFLSDLSAFSLKNQEKLMKKAMMEQEKINREAEKIVKWAKQASARLDISSIEDELSDDDTFK
ncbi:uncharacterized protein LOC107767343 [Nicotiana tabacum]|uniref:Uncharacterized protein LOC107767343 n=1 Tax=Nicotiana tabacum TaxID=4097 RepID=A0A1S3XPC7_TOBAC|nr:PREDICTED: uncharacterized protein LOC107767343 [Nicotiana tabacum]